MDELQFLPGGQLKQNRHNRRLIFAKTGGICTYCGRAIDPFGRWHIEHMQPKKKGGHTDYENLWPACQACNLKKGGRTPEEYRQVLVGWAIVGADYVEMVAGLVCVCNPEMADQLKEQASAIRQTASDYLPGFYFEKMESA